MQKGVWFGLTIMAMVVIATVALLPAPSQITQGHLGLLMLSLIVVAIMLGFPTAFTLMGMGIMFAFASYSMQGFATGQAIRHTLDLFVQRAYWVMTNDVLISIPLFVFMGYLVERANLIEKLFRSLHLSLARIPGSLAVATLVTCAVFATATGIVGAVVTLMGLLAFPAMLKAGYNVKLSAGVVTAGGCLGILIPPSVMLIVYGATAGVSVVQLYAGAFLPGIMLAALYVGYVMVLAKIKPQFAPPLTAEERKVDLPAHAAAVARSPNELAVPGLFRALRGKADAALAKPLRRDLIVAVLPGVVLSVILGLTWHAITKPNVVQDFSGLQALGSAGTAEETEQYGGLAPPPPEGTDTQAASSTGLAEPPQETSPTGLAEPPKEAEAAQPKVAPRSSEVKVSETKTLQKAVDAEWQREPAGSGFWITAGVIFAILVALYATLTWVRLEVFKMLLASFFPLAVLILAVLGTIVFGLATPTEAAAVGSVGGFVLAAIYMYNASAPERKRQILRTWIPLWAVFLFSVVWFLLVQFEVLTTSVPLWVGWISMVAFAIWCVMAIVQVNLWPTLRESVFLTAKTSAMVCWLFVGSSIFSAAFALLGGQEIVERWVLSLGLTPVQFMVLAQIIIFLLGWPLEWTEIIVIFMPIFIPLLAKFNIDPLFFGLLVALNLQTAFLSPPVAMAAFYLKGVAPPHVTLNSIFLGMMPFMVIQVIALVLLYAFPEIGLWLPKVLYK
ncbi:MAG TPA: TRAP transporter large permease subunit [Usitatibacter sp.]|nr:TRAP transporter large permease subunit [Usitatibacter sp.]